MIIYKPKHTFLVHFFLTLIGKFPCKFASIRSMVHRLWISFPSIRSGRELLAHDLENRNSTKSNIRRFSDKKTIIRIFFAISEIKNTFFFHILYIFYPNEKNIYPNRFRIKKSSSLARPKNIRSFKREIYGPYFMNHRQ